MQAGQGWDGMEMERRSGSQEGEGGQALHYHRLRDQEGGRRSLSGGRRRTKQVTKLGSSEVTRKTKTGETGRRDEEEDEADEGESRRREKGPARPRISSSLAGSATRSTLRE
ncbi:hypothetical protein MGYG_08941 [Nannizzia gypsea CBS 118893]|uniref:Uncharacterized protein n=1 Tax=Arthroderma gypseum (strain ATCC MYA-4604 / CBS 118893) TaxID=535722 RepID=E5R267_ARTGP|nr:hypothetical protein MGYG_08941 [Nannizzia gypsea CBS 118893]EFQ98631.1 hypothetical protein MGYG_08941 [Nannizzia gypsea CBS 118893]